MVKFLRRIWKRYSKLGRKRKKKQVWRRPKGRDNKMRERRRGYPVRVEVGYKKGNRKKEFIVNTLLDLEKVNKNDLVVIGKVGRRKKIELLKKAEEKKIPITNLNLKKYLEKDKKEKKK